MKEQIEENEKEGRCVAARGRGTSDPVVLHASSVHNDENREAILHRCSAKPVGDIIDPIWSRQS